jgi:hypothetical protein
MDADRALAIIASLDRAERTLNDIRIYRHGGRQRDDIARHRATLSEVRRQLETARPSV